MVRARCYTHFAGDPYFNMAFDDWMLKQVLNRPATVLLRLYTWQTPAITIGYNQDPNRTVRASLLDGTPLIRRVTGGRAVYHDLSELTYSIAVNPEGLSSTTLTGSLSQTLRAISVALRSFLAQLGVSSDYVRGSAPRRQYGDFFQKAPCFASAARFELVADGRKVVASAQKRIGSVLLQHGAMKLFGAIDHPALTSRKPAVLRDPEPITKKAFREWAPVFRSVLGESLGIDFDLSVTSQPDLDRISHNGMLLKKKTIGKQTIKRTHDAQSL